MNKLCMSLLGRTFHLQKHNNLSKLNQTSIHQFASSKQSKDPKSQPSKQSPPNFSKQVLKTSPSQPPNQKKPNKQSTQILTQEQRKDLIFKQKLQAEYHQLQSLPSDSYQTIVQNFKRIKAQLNDRKVYLPNKPELLTQLDNSMEFVKKHHSVWMAPSTAPERRLSDSKAEVIEWELEEAKKKFYLSLLENEKVLILIATGIISIFVGLQYYFFVREEEDPSLKAPKMFL